MSFSSAVILTDLNDYITPSQACIKPVEAPKVTDSNAQLKVAANGDYYQVEIDGTETKLEKATISLNDCLACSGCITSAESVLISMQSHQELYKVLAQDGQDKKIVCVSISSQARASLGGKYGFHQQQIWQKLQYFLLETLKVNYVFDVDFARDFALLESAKQFVARFQQKENLPMLASSCPGWICYAEKTHPSILNLIDSTKSPQQIMGSLVKQYMASQLNVSPSDIYHVSIMPCYDKKLEASRQDFYDDIYKTRDVDLVLSTAELEHVILEKNCIISNIPEEDYHSLFMKGDGKCLVGTEGSSSGGYLSFVMRYAVYHLYGINLSWKDIEQGQNGISIIPGRNADFTEVRYQPPNSSEPTLRFAYAYGFRNIQNMVRKAKKPLKRQEFHFVEIMACPSGCINGGGQIKAPSESLQVLKEWTASAQKSYSISDDIIGPESNEMIQRLYKEWLYTDELVQKHLHTQYHAVQSTVSGLTTTW